MPRLESRTALAKLAGVSQMAVTKQCAGALAPACVGKRVDLGHPAVVSWLKKRGVAPTVVVAKARKAKSKPTPDGPNTADELPSRSQELTPAEMAWIDERTRPIIERYGTMTALRDLLTAAKLVEDLREKRLKNEDTESSVIARDIVKGHVFGAINGMALRLLNDASKTLTRRLYALAKSGVPAEEAEKVVRDLIGTAIRDAKARIVQVLGDA